MSGYNIDKNSLDSALNEMRRLVTDSEEYSDTTFLFESFVNKNPKSVIAAIDGSHHNVKGKNFVFSTLRAGYLLYKDKKLLKSVIDPIKIELIMNNDERDIGFRHKHEKYFHRITGQLPSGKLEFDKVTERIRTLLEWEKIKYLIQTLNRGDIIVFDGALVSGEISISHDFVRQLSQIAQEKGIALVGLSKDTTLAIGAAPIPVILQRASSKQHPNRNWFVQYEDTYFVRFTKQKDYIFRVDAVLPPDMEMKTLLSYIGAFTYDSATPGYPHPMQAVHDSVRISQEQRDYCFEEFKKLCIKSDLSNDTLNQLFAIYHDQLDKISLGR